jgi:hypothetical protein
MNKYEIALLIADALRNSKITNDTSAALIETDGDFQIDYRQRGNDGRIYKFTIDVSGGFMVNKFTETEDV